MKEPCKTCPEREKDFGGCRCQAYMLTGDVRNADPVCNKSPYHGELLDKLTQLQSTAGSNETPLVFRNMPNSRKLLKGETLN